MLVGKPTFSFLREDQILWILWEKVSQKWEKLAFSPIFFAPDQIDTEFWWESQVLTFLKDDYKKLKQICKQFAYILKYKAYF